MWLKLLFAVVSILVSIDSPTPNSPDQPVGPPAIPQDDSSNTSPTQPDQPNHPDQPVQPTQPDQPNQPAQPSNPTDVPEPDNTPPVTPPNPSDMLNLHIMVASHTDAGWIHTFERYYQGTNSLDGGCVKCILDNVLNTLPGNKDRKYDMSEISFFKRWWIDQGEEKRNKFKTMLQNKQFEFINGAWAANDEATAYYEGIMDNFILGHRWLQDTLDVDPLIGWQVDSFGNSATHAGLMAQAGYEGMFFSRADYVDRDTRRAGKSLQFNWAPPNPHNESVFTQMMYVTYSDTKFMIADNYNCRSVFCHGNLNPSQYQQVADYVKKQQSAFRTKNILFMVCDDFLLWQGAEKDYVGAEAMVEYYRQNPQFGINAKISHLSDYLNQVKEDLISMGQVGHIPERHDDTFPYVEKSGHVWTGYFTSKPMFKLLVREYGEYYNAVKLLLAKIMLAENWSADQHSSVNQNLIALEEPLAIVQHHDAVSGTMKEVVRFDYEDMLNKARDQLETVIRPLIVNYLKGKINEELTNYPFKYDWFYRDNSYNSIFKDDSTTTFSVFNPGQTRKLLIKVKIPSANYAIKDETNFLVDSDLICHSEDNNSDCFIYFVDEFPAYATKVYKINKSTIDKKLVPTQINNQDQELSAGGLTFKVKGDLKNFEYNYCQGSGSENCAGDSFSLDYKYYQSGRAGGDSPSGAYVFTPIPQEKMDYSTLKSGRVFKGKHISVVQIFRNNLRTEISVHSHQPERGVEITTFLDPVTPQPSGKEIVLLVHSGSIKNGNTEFYTDSNGYFMQKRVKNHKDNFNLDTKNSINVNFYPMTSNIYIQDESSGKRLSIVTDRAQGASSLNPGEVEVMIHRVTTNDDNKGVGEFLQEKDRGTNSPIRVTTRHFLSFSNSQSEVPDQRRNQQYDLDRSAQLRFYSSNSDVFAAETATAGSQSQQFVPDLVKLYVRSYSENEYIVRLHNLDEVNSKQALLYDLESKVSGLLEELSGKSVKVKAIEELSWMTTREKSDVLKNMLDPNEPDVTHQDGENFSSISLLPMEIRTFSIQV